MFSQLVFYVFFAAAAAVATTSYIRLRQSGLYASGLAVRNERMRRKQSVSSIALGHRKKLTDQKQEVVGEVLGGEESAARLRQLARLTASYDAQEAVVAREYERIDGEADARLAEQRRWRRVSLAVDSALLVLSVGAMAALVVIDFGG